MYYILEINKSIFDIYTNKNGAIVHLFKINKLNSNCCIKEFNHGCITGNYKIKNNKILYTSLNKGDIITNEIDEIPFELVFNSETPSTDTQTKKSKIISSDINVQMPPINTEIRITSGNESDDDENVDVEELKRKIDELSKLKEAEMNELEGLNQNLHEFENEIIKEKFNVDEEKNKLRRDKEKWEEFKNIFNADKRIYKIMKEQFANGDIEIIPELFEKKFPIFQTLDEQNLLDADSEIYDYIKLLPEDNSVYIPKNVIFKGLFNDNGISSISLTEFKDTQVENTIDTDDES
jgi:hypothetical protein